MAMKKVKLGEIKLRMETVETGKQLFGATAKFINEYQKRLKELGKALCKEKKVTKKKFVELPMETEFSSKEVTDLYDSLCKWLTTQGA